MAGVERSGPRTTRAWSELTAQSRRLGFVRLVEPIERLQQHLGGKAEVTAWDPTPAARAVLELCLCCRVLEDMPS